MTGRSAVTVDKVLLEELARRKVRAYLKNPARRDQLRGLRRLPRGNCSCSSRSVIRRKTSPVMRKEPLAVLVDGPLRLPFRVRDYRENRRRFTPAATMCGRFGSCRPPVRRRQDISAGRSRPSEELRSCSPRARRPSSSGGGKSSTRPTSTNRWSPLTGDSKAIAAVTLATYQIVTHHRPKKDGDFPHFTIFNERDWGLIIYERSTSFPPRSFGSRPTSRPEDGSA